MPLVGRSIRPNVVGSLGGPKLFADLLKGAAEGCLGRNAQFVDDEKSFRFASIALNG